MSKKKTGPAKGMFVVEVDSETDLGTKTVDMRPAKVGIIECLRSNIHKDGEPAPEVLMVYYDGQPHPYRIEMPLEQFRRKMDSVEEDDA